ncbi:serine/threonine protein kinase [Saprolegnia diclina VS20]|uniref:Serine/threonine protein kinase n=1 Tax=Saprolegnia diclina (strain VS20) TaxID=1156394 RepID=T0RWM4_SAPDV|nr:serine/threonine protein kinase [Saprolegnia diclina VS20]EQC34757.1 serine/threonine protein kinase [Saprolegnia diclina VS20]|eukprot:XP_008611629.1 serine/threonine protein kinase [Saprolegnia diclina VS20]
MENYIVLRPLADAIYGRILLCRHVSTSAVVAIKLIDMAHATAHTTVADGHTVDENVVNELAVNLAVRDAGGHDHICPLQAHFYFDQVLEGNDAGTRTMLALVFAYCPQKELLATLSAATRFAEALALRYLTEINAALTFLHTRHFAHRDVSLENVLLTASGACQLCDFGLATAAATPAAEPVGKLLYMAPEVRRGGTYAPMQADMWSLGVALFTMVVGRYPFNEAVATDGFYAAYRRGGLASLLHAHNAHVPSSDVQHILRHLLQLLVPPPTNHAAKKPSFSSRLKSTWRRWRPWARRVSVPTSAA